MLITEEGRDLIEKNSTIHDSRINHVVFPLFNTLKSYTDQYNYVHDVLCELARNKALWLTELMHQNDINSRTVAMYVLTGVTIVDKSMTFVGGLPPDLANYRVKIKSLITESPSSITWKEGVKPYTSNKRGIIKYIDHIKIIDPDKDGFFYVSIPTAIKILGQSGRNFRKAKSTRMQKKVWKCEEVMPENHGKMNVSKNFDAMVKNMNKGEVEACINKLVDALNGVQKNANRKN